MEITLTVNGKHVKATVDEQEMKAEMAVIARKKTGYEKNFDIIAYIVDRDGEAKSYNAINHLINITEPIYNAGNYYTVESVAENNARADSLMRNLRRFAAEMHGCLSGKKTQKMETWHIYMNKYGNLDVAQRVSADSHLFGEIAFATYVSASKAIEIFKDELLWYFNEYDPMPEGWWEN